MSLWIFLRHGQSTANAARVFSGHEDVALTELGRSQAVAAGESLRETLQTHPDLLVLSSTLQRAKNTVSIALETIGYTNTILTFDSLRERHLGDWQGVSIDELKASGARDTLLQWDGRPPGGESLKDLASRILPCLAEHDTGKTVLVGSHGGVVRTAIGLVDRMPLPELCRWNVGNCQPIIREIPQGTWRKLADTYAQRQAR